MISRLFTTLYPEPRPSRRAELDYCLAVNAFAIDKLYILAEGDLPGCPANAEIVKSEGRQSYSGVLKWAALVADPDDVTVIANCDIIIPISSIAQIAASISSNEVYCLSRYEINRGGSLKLFDVNYSQDVWAFRGKPKAVGGDYFFGVPGCDNRFAHELKEAGYTVLNPSRTIKTLHLHASRERTLTNSRGHRIPPPYLFIEPTELLPREEEAKDKTAQPPSFISA